MPEVVAVEMNWLLLAPEVQVAGERAVVNRPA
jgi:hypothetical protein